MDARKRRLGDGEQGFQIVQRRQGKQIAVEYQLAKHGSKGEIFDLCAQREIKERSLTWFRLKTQKKETKRSLGEDAGYGDGERAMALQRLRMRTLLRAAMTTELQWM
ncbi:hypothetical protein MRB53_003882 [Persea americana]|uniref:Uncharacterized protein n=1 Tax=Persea americana TaxID=3435 RepID=A0ACC2MYX6_PERAE|nr:hypothetical protein MRB53_003882 [Persea americana]